MYTLKYLTLVFFSVCVKCLLSQNRNHHALRLCLLIPLCCSNLIRDCVAVMEWKVVLTPENVFCCRGVSLQKRTMCFGNFTVWLCHSCLYDVLLSLTQFQCHITLYFVWRSGPALLCRYTLKSGNLTEGHFLLSTSSPFSRFNFSFLISVSVCGELM